MADNQTLLPAGKLLKRKSPEANVVDASAFWTNHGLGKIVSREEFVLGVLAFIEIEDTKRRMVTTCTDPSSSPLNRLHTMTDQQVRAVQIYATKQTYAKSGNLIKRLLIAIIEMFLKLFDALHVWICGLFKIPVSHDPQLKNNWDHIRSLSRAHSIVLATCIFAAMTQGWDQASMNGANIQWPEEFGLRLTLTTKNPNSNSDWLFSWLNAAPFFSGAWVGLLITDPVINEGAFGRRLAIIVAGMFSLASVVGAAFTDNTGAFMACRLLLGVGMGAKASVVPVYISEVAPEEVRGILAMTWQIFDTCGIFLGSCANLAVFNRNRESPNWRFMIGLPFIPALIFLVLACFCIESPRWLMKRMRMADALKALIDFHDLPSPIVACGDFYLTFCRLKEEEKTFMKVLDKHPLWKWPGFRSYRNNMKRRGIIPDPPSETVMDNEHQANDIELQRPAGSSSQHMPQIFHQDVFPNDSSLQPEASAQSMTNTTGPVNNPPESNMPPRPDATSVPSQERLVQPNWLDRWSLLLLLPRMRNAVYASTCVMTAQQACGINILAFLSSTIFYYIGTRSNVDPNDTDIKGKSLHFSLYFGLVNFVCTWIAIPLIDWKGRRYLLKISFPLMALCMFCIAGLFNLKDDGARIAAFQCFALLFTAVFSIGEGPTAFVISSEVFPLIVRELGMSQAVFSNFFWASVVSFLVPIMVTAMQNGWFWALFGVFNVICWRMSCLLVQETQKESIEDIDKIYGEKHLKRKTFKKMKEVKLLMWIGWHMRNVGSGSKGKEAAVHNQQGTTPSANGAQNTTPSTANISSPAPQLPGLGFQSSAE